MIKWLNLRNLKVLDFGVGTGSVWKELYLYGIRDIQVLGLDIAPGMLKIAKEKRIPWLKVLEKQIEDSSYTNCFNVVCAHGLLKHCADPTIAVKKAHKALTPAGQLFVQSLSREDDILTIIKRLTTEIKDYLKPSKRKTSFYMKDGELIQLIENVGFQKQRCEKFVYTLAYRSFEHIKKFITEKTIFGIYTYKTIPLKYRRHCNRIFLQIIKEELEKPLVHRRSFICLFKKVKH
jgi:2-polyprenyl-3-methyl-5-hydroxy-6-metoxy-1,4-benzoquinol methylase